MNEDDLDISKRAKEVLKENKKKKRVKSNPVQSRVNSSIAWKKHQKRLQELELLRQQLSKYWNKKS